VGCLLGADVVRVSREVETMELVHMLQNNAQGHDETYEMKSTLVISTERQIQLSKCDASQFYASRKCHFPYLTCDDVYIGIIASEVALGLVHTIVSTNGFFFFWSVDVAVSRGLYTHHDRATVLRVGLVVCKSNHAVVGHLPLRRTSLLRKRTNS